MPLCQFSYSISERTGVERQHGFDMTQVTSSSVYTVLHAITSLADYMKQQIHLPTLRKYCRYKLNLEKGRFCGVWMWELLFMQFLTRGNYFESWKQRNKKGTMTEPEKTKRTDVNGLLRIQTDLNKNDQTVLNKGLNAKSN